MADVTRLGLSGFTRMPFGSFSGKVAVNPSIEGHINDIMASGLRNQNSGSGDVDTELNVYLAGLTSSTGATRDLWETYFDNEGIGAGSFNDRAMEWLGGFGYTDESLNERFRKYWNSLT